MALLLKELGVQDEQSLLNRLKQDYDWAESERSTHKTDWENGRKRYNCEWTELTAEEDDEDIDNLWFYVPLTYNHIHRIECAARAHFFPPGQLKLGKVRAAFPRAADVAAAEIADAVLHTKIDIELNPVRAITDAFNAGLVEGVGVLKGGWVARQTVDANGRVQKVSKATLSYLPNEHVLWDPYALTPDDIVFFIHEMWMTEDELWALQEAGIYQNVEKIGKSESADPGRDTWRESIASPGNRPRWLYKVWEFWGPQQLLDEDRLDTLHKAGRHQTSVDVVATTIENRILLRLEENSYSRLLSNATPYEKLPFWLCIPLPERGTTFARGLCERLLPIQREVGIMRNQRRQAVDLEMTGKVFIDRNRGINIKDVTSNRYMGVVPCDGEPRSAVYDWHPQTSTGQMAQEEGIIDGDAREMTGVTNWHMGNQQPGIETATATSIITQEGNVKLDNLLQNMGDSAVVPILRFFTACVREMVTPEEVQDIIGSETAPPDLKTILKDYRIELEAGASATSKAVQVRNIQTALQVLGQIASAAPQKALPAMDALMPRLLQLLGTPEAVSQYIDSQQQGMGAGYGANPAGQGQPAMSNFQNDAALQMQGRAPMAEETPVPPMLR
jgi:hypothetical protein